MDVKSPNIAITAPFRDGAGYLAEFIEQINSLDYPAENIRIFCIEGDSKDNTWQLLTDWVLSDKRVKLIRYDTGQPKYPSTVNPDRFRHLSKVFNTCLASSLADGWADYVCLIPSDVIFGPDLLKGLLQHNKDIISPMYWTGDHPNGSRFYDIWGYKDLEGIPFPPRSFAWYQTEFPTDGPVQLQTTGGVMLSRREVLEAGCRYTETDVDHGLCWTATEKGYTIWCDPQTHIIHR